MPLDRRKVGLKLLIFCNFGYFARWAAVRGTCPGVEEHFKLLSLIYLDG